MARGNWILLCSLLAEVACSSGGDPEMGGGSTDGGISDPQGKRTDMECPDYLKLTEKNAESVKLPVKTEAGSWGGLASSLQILPAGATVCGAIYFLDGAGQPLTTAGSIVSVAIRSPLYGSELKKEYERLLAGCTFSRDDSKKSQTNMTWDCSDDKGPFVNLVTDTSHSYYLVGGIVPSP